MDGVWHYAAASQDYALLADTFEHHYYFDENGCWLPETWLETENGRMLRLGNGEMAVNGLYQSENQKTYYFDSNGWMKTGWVRLNGSNMYFEATGERASNCCVEGKWYVNEEGIWIPEAWEKTAQGWMLRKGDGSYARSEILTVDNGETYCFNAQGLMQTGWVKNQGKDYYFVSSGEMAKNRWIQGKWYVGADGAWIQSHWARNENGSWSFVYGDGTKVRNERLTIGGQQYRFDSNGNMITGWYQEGNKWYYFDRSGQMLKRQMVNDWYVNGNGIGYTGYDIEIAQACDKVYDQVGMDLYKVFRYVVENMKYTVLPIPLPIVGNRSDLQNYAHQAITLYGNCYCYAAFFTYLAHGLGYEPEFVQGLIPYRNGIINHHGWVVMYEDGVKYYYDPEGSYERGIDVFRYLREQAPWPYDR